MRLLLLVLSNILPASWTKAILDKSVNKRILKLQRLLHELDNSVSQMVDKATEADGLQLLMRAFGVSPPLPLVLPLPGNEIVAAFEKRFGFKTLHGEALRPDQVLSVCRAMLMVMIDKLEASKSWPLKERVVKFAREYASPQANQ